ncbi:hypothetical protein [Gymnodinialimonas sp. 57CJ19]|uniref:hypothetical protein n=1 Tax=Gymnodinialimonas sp. 57CJ19 TaxID=3138498 RepID=UPI00313463EA
MRSVADAPWACASALDLALATPPRAVHAMWHYQNLLRVAYRLGAEDVERLVLTHMADVAFRAGSPQDFIGAGFHWSASDLTP